MKDVNCRNQFQVTSLEDQRAPEKPHSRLIDTTKMLDKRTIKWEAMELLKLMNTSKVARQAFVNLMKDIV